MTAAPTEREYNQGHDDPKGNRGAPRYRPGGGIAVNTQNSRYREIGKVEEWFERHAWIVRNFDLLVALLFLAVGLALVAGHADWDFPWFILASAIGFIARRWVPRGYLLAMSLLLFVLSRDAGEALHRPLYLSSIALAAMWFIRFDRLDLLRRWPSRP